VVSDAILVLAPVRLVWRIKLTPAQKIRVISIFSTTLVTTAISLNHAYFVLKWGGLQEALAAVMQVIIDSFQRCASLFLIKLPTVLRMFDSCESERHNRLLFQNQHRRRRYHRAHIQLDG